jgi:hypothetical protein
MAMAVHSFHSFHFIHVIHVIYVIHVIRFIHVTHVIHVRTMLIYIYMYIYTRKKHISICGGRARPRGPRGSMKYQFVYLNVVTVCLDELDSVCSNGRAGQGQPSGR